MTRGTLSCEAVSGCASSALRLTNALPRHLATPPRSYEWWWTDEAFSGQVQPLGHSVQRGCYPYNQQIARKGTWSVETLQVRGSARGWSERPEPCAATSFHSASATQPPARHPSSILSATPAPPLLQHKNPSVLRDLQLRLRRPDWRPVTGISPWAPCTSASLRDDGAVGCSYNYWRPSMTRQL